ncbi:MAG: transporter substrate-binding domain-containing protein [Desulfurococcales archaeon]|nr:transporter substrate-binding domain-containing protein [Desulfurococcales archaeon]
MNSWTLAVIVIVIVALGGVAYYSLSHQGSPAQTQTSTNTQTATQTQTSQPTSTTAGSSSQRILKVGTSPDFPPFEFIDDKGNIVGFDIDLVNTLANMTGYKVQIVSMSFDSLILALQNKQIDVIAAGLTIRPDREKVVAFTIPYWNATMSIVVRNGSSFMPKSLDDLVGKTVGAETSTTGEMLLKDYVNQTGKQINIKSYENFILIVQDLVNGKLDAAMIDTPVAQSFTKQYPVTISATIDTGQRFALAVNKDDTQLLNQLNAALQQLLNSPEWDKLVSKWFG